MPNPIKLSAKLPKDQPLNGLDTVHAQLAAHGTAYVVMSVSAHEVVDRLDGQKQPIMVIDHIEGLPEGDSGLAVRGRNLMRDARAARERADGVMPGMENMAQAGEPVERVRSPRADDPEY